MSFLQYNDAEACEDPENICCKLDPGRQTLTALNKTELLPRVVAVSTEIRTPTMELDVSDIAGQGYPL